MESHSAFTHDEAEGICPNKADENTTAIIFLGPGYIGAREIDNGENRTPIFVKRSLPFSCLLLTLSPATKHVLSLSHIFNNYTTPPSLLSHLSAREDHNNRNRDALFGQAYLHCPTHSIVITSTRVCRTLPLPLPLQTKGLNKADP